jgi:hypothetical protein
MDTQETSKPAGKTTAKKKGAKLPLKAQVLKRRFSVERPHETTLAIAIVSEAIREQMRRFVEENGGRKACCHRISIQEDSIVYELRDVQNSPQCVFNPLNPPTKDNQTLSTIPPDAV